MPCTGHITEFFLMTWLARAYIKSIPATFSYLFTFSAFYTANIWPHTFSNCRYRPALQITNESVICPRLMLKLEESASGPRCNLTGLSGPRSLFSHNKRPHLQNSSVQFLGSGCWSQSRIVEHCTVHCTVHNAQPRPRIAM